MTYDHPGWEVEQEGAFPTEYEDDDFCGLCQNVIAEDDDTLWYAGQDAHAACAEQAQEEEGGERD